MTEREKIAAKIKALMSKTVENGCSEAEAMQAAATAGRLMARYELTSADIDTWTCADKWGKRARPGARPGSKSSRHHETVNVCRAIAEMCDCRAWTAGGDVVFFGQEQDTLIAHYLFDLIRAASETEWKRYLTSGARPAGVHGRTLRASFMAGFCQRMAGRCREMARQKHADIAESAATGNALVIVKGQELARRIEALQLNLRKSRNVVRVNSDTALNAGRASADRVTINPGVGSMSAGQITN